MAFDFNPNGVFENVDYSFDVFAVDTDTAYADRFSNLPGPPAYDVGTDPFADVTLGGGGETIVTITLPMGGGDGDLFGGDADCSYFAGDMRFTLFDGLFQLPSTPGDYTIDVLATSVDMDTGDFDDGMGFTPLTYPRQVMVTVPEPAPALGATVALLALAALRRRRRWGRSEPGLV